jgi:sulfatase modifying factor 1
MAGCSLVFSGMAHADTPATHGETVSGMKFVFVKGGCYEMGDVSGDGALEEKPPHRVCVNDFYMGVHEVTQGQWRLIVGNSPSHFKVSDEYPVETVSWDDTQEFISKLNQKTGKTYRLPSEAEWEYAARSGGAKERWAGTSYESELGAYAWYVANSDTTTHPVGQKTANRLGLYDMSGNVWEWVLDRFDRDYYGESPKDNPQGPAEKYERLLRGGSWYNNPWVLRTSYRLPVGPPYKADNAGFRLVLPVPPPPPEVKAAPPPPPPPPPPKPVILLKDINFDFDKYSIRSYDEEVLRHNLAWFKENAGKKVKIEGHCDERGSAEYNLVLGQKRADEVRSFLISLGVDGKSLETVSYGKERPLDPRHNEEAWTKNRRIHLVPIE